MNANRLGFFVFLIIELLAFNLFAQVNDAAVKDIDGNVYHTVTIGTQTWMIENLKTTKYSNGDAIPQIVKNKDWSSLKTGGFCFYENNAANAETFGFLYNWNAVNDVRKLAPTGWHVATDSEWAVLTDFLNGPGAAGGKLKEAGTTHWKEPNVGGTNESGFSAFPGGYRNKKGEFADAGNRGLWWSTSVNQTPNTWSRSLHYLFNYVSRSSAEIQWGLSVRCVKD